MRLRSKRKKLNALGKTILILNFIAVLALLLCYLAPYVNPAYFWPLAFFSIAYVPILFINAVFLVFWMLRMRMLALVSGGGILLGSGLMVHNIGFHKQCYENKRSSPGYIRMMTYNVYDFSDTHMVYENTCEPIFKIVNEQHPDVVNMQEFFIRKREIFHDRFIMVDSLKKALRTPYYWFRPIQITQHDSTGSAIFSKYPIVHRDTIPYINGSKTDGIFVDLKKDGKIFRVYNFHLRSTSFASDENDYLQHLSNGTPDLHRSRSIGGKLKRAFIERGKQVVGIKKLLDQCPYPYIITGDFNDTPLSFAVNYLGRGLKNAFCEKGYGLGVTFYGEYPGFQLDYILTSPQFNVISYKILRERLSDHYPVLSDLELK